MSDEKESVSPADPRDTTYTRMMLRRGEIDRQIHAITEESASDPARGTIRDGRDNILAIVNRDGYVVISATTHAPNTGLSLGLGLVRLFTTPEQFERVQAAMAEPQPQPSSYYYLRTAVKPFVSYWLAGDHGTNTHVPPDPVLKLPSAAGPHRDFRVTHADFERLVEAFDP